MAEEILLLQAFIPVPVVLDLDLCCLLLAWGELEGKWSVKHQYEDNVKQKSS